MRFSLRLSSFLFANSVTALGLMFFPQEAAGQSTDATPVVHFYQSVPDTSACPALVPVPSDTCPWGVDPGRLLPILGDLDAMRPFEPDSASEKIAAVFADSYEEQGLERFYVVRANFDGEFPPDYCVHSYGEGSSRSHGALLVVRNASRIVLQSIGGERRGLANLYGSLVTAIRRDTSHKRDSYERVYSLANELIDRIYVSILDANNDGRDDYIAHTNVYFHSYEDDACLQPFQEWYSTMAGVTDFPVPYFWDGTKMAFDRVQAKVYYESASSQLAGIQTVHSCLLRRLIADFLKMGRLSPCPGSSW